nr:MAG TPA: hypothetical protein [Caudoviricetes sp.]
MTLRRFISNSTMAVWRTASAVSAVAVLSCGSVSQAAVKTEKEYLEQVTVGLVQCYQLATVQNQNEITKLDATGGDVISFVVMNACSSSADAYLFYCQRVDKRSAKDCAGDLPIMVKDVMYPKRD